jgi:predicted TIM-barrel fold metal-dependent hydrolase
MPEHSKLIDCDIHPSVPRNAVLLPFMDEYWKEQFISRGIAELDLASYPPNALMSCRADWRVPNAKPASDLATVQKQILDPSNASFAICNCLYGGQVVHSELMGMALCKAVNDWIAKEWLDRDPRLRASIMVPSQSPRLAVEEIERLKDDKRFVQVLLLVASDMMLGRSYYWPIYEAAERHNLPVGIHAGSMQRNPATLNGYPSYAIHDYCNHSQTFAMQLQSLIAEGVFAKYPKLRIVLIESGVSWLPPYLWRADKNWRGLRGEIPWVDRLPTEIVRHHVRLTTQPFDVPNDAAKVDRLINQLGSDEMLIFSTDYPHWQFEDDKSLPAGLSQDLIRKIMWDNPRNTYPNLQETVQ